MKTLSKQSSVTTTQPVKKPEVSIGDPNQGTSRGYGERNDIDTLQSSLDVKSLFVDLVVGP